MRLELLGAEASAGLVVTFHEAAGGEIRWSVGNDSDRPVTVERVALRWRVEADGPLRMFLHGWQSWSASGSGVVGVDEDPARQPTALGLFRAGLHADAAVPPAGELRSELVTVLADDADSVCIGFDSGARHDGTIRVPGDLVVAEAYLGGALLAAGERRDLHTVRVDVAGPDPAVSLDAWAQWAGRCSAARTQAPYQLGWGSWYHYFHGITEAALRENLAPAADSWPFDVFQLDDGYQAATGDWLVTNDKFPSGLERIAADVAARGLTPGLWLAPFLATPSSQVAQNHPGWFARHPAGHPVIGYVNAGWGGEAWVLDTTAPEVLDHLEGLGRTLAAMGWRYLKLDFTYAPTFEGQWRDPSPTPAQRVRAGFDAIRCGAGDDVFVLGCGAPLGACIGAVDGMRIGPDVAPHWLPAAEMDGFAYKSTLQATQNAWRNTLARSFQHRRLWLNDPDCLMLRSTDTQMTPAQIEAWALAVGVSGGMAMVSDDLALLDDSARDLLDEVVTLGRKTDAASRTGPAPSCPDLLAGWTPTTLLAGGTTLVGEPDDGTASVRN